MLFEAVMLMLTGMGVVFAFLLVLTGLTYLLTYSCPPAPDSSTPAAPTADHDEAAAVSPEHLAAISAALAAYRGRES